MTITKESLIQLIPSSWKGILQSELEQNYWNSIAETLSKCEFLPKIDNIFAALRDIVPDDVKVIMLGQDPYPTKGASHGYSFSVNKGTRIPPSLRNIFYELSNEYKSQVSPKSGNLTQWEKDGVLLLNTILTVKPSQPLSHKGIGWEYFTTAILKYFAEKDNVVYLVLGSKAREAISNINIQKERIVSAGHPSPLNTSGTFIGSDCFIKVNEELMKRGRLPIRWLNLEYEL